MSQARRALVALISVIAVVLGFAPAAFVSVAAAANAAPSSSARAVHTAVNTPGPGYWLVASDGGVFSNGAADFHGSTGATALNKPIVGIAATPTGNGYWMVASDGGIFSFGDAAFHGSTGAMSLNKPIVGMASTPSGAGYWLVASDGGIFAFGDATFHGSTGAMALNKPIVGMTSTPKGNGYLLVASDGGIFAFGDATFHGSTGAMSLNKPITGIASTPTGSGYWMVASDGGIFSFGDAHFFGSTGATALNMPIVGMAASRTGNGYWFVAADGGVFAFGDAHFFGTASTQALNMPIVGMAASAPMVAAPPPATKLAFTTEPSPAATGGAAFAIQPVVTVQDASGATVPTDTSAVTLEITTPAGATLACTANPSTAVSGVATFAGCNINHPGTYTLTATDGALTSATSASITITIGPAAKLGFSTQPSGAASSVAFLTQPSVQVQDLGGNLINTDTSTVTLTLTTPGASVLACTPNTHAAVAGVATFTGCKVDLSGSYTLHAADGVLATATSAQFSITAGPASQLLYSTQPGATTGGSLLSPQPAVRVADAAGNTVTTDVSGVTLTITAPANGAVLTCTANPKNAVAGVATFAGCNINLNSTHTLTATDAALTPAISGSLVTTTGAAAKLGFTAEPSASTGGINFTTQPVVAVQDLGGNTVTTNTSGVTLSINAPTGGAVLGCTNNGPVAAVAGVATFAGCDINLAGTYTLHAADGALTPGTSASLLISVGPAAKLAFTTQPVGSTGGVAFATQPVVKVQDAGGNTVTTDTSIVTLEITAPAVGATLTCTPTSPNTQTAVAGVATFVGCNIDLAGSHTLTATDGALAAPESVAVDTATGPAAKLGFTTQPSASTGGVNFTTQPVVAVQDLGGNTVTTNTSGVTLSINAPTGGAVLGCTNNGPVAAVAGVATFAGCDIDVAGTYTLHAADGAFTPGTSASLVISVGPAAKLAFTTQPGGVAVNTAFTPQPVVTVQDAGGNTVTTDVSSVTLALEGPGDLTCTANPQVAVAGVATFAACQVDTAGVGDTLTATDGVLTLATSTAFTITP